MSFRPSDPPARVRPRGGGLGVGAMVAATAVVAGCGAAGGTTSPSGPPSEAGNSAPWVSTSGSGEPSTAGGFDRATSPKTADGGAGDGMSTVTAAAGVSPSEVVRIRDAAPESWRRCALSWPEPPPPLHVEVKTSPAVDPRAVAPTATTVVVGENGVGPATIEVDARAASDLSDEGLRIVLTHECVHVVIAHRPHPPAPRWLVEGTAELVAYDHALVDLDDVVAPLVARSRRDGPPPALPGDDEFELAHAARREDLLDTYAQAATAARSYARRHGMPALIALLTGGPPHGGYAAVESDLLPYWRADLSAPSPSRPRRPPATG